MLIIPKNNGSISYVTLENTIIFDKGYLEMVKVVKFGGSSLADAEQFKKVAEIIKSEDSRRYVVASAPGKRYDDDIKVTDMLYSCYKLVKENKDIDEAFKLIEDRYNGIIKDLGLDFWLQPEFDRIKNAIVHHAGRDYIASRGEYLNSMILAKYLGYDFVDAEEGIFFTENGVLDTEKTNEELTKILKEHTHAVVPGFYTETYKGGHNYCIESRRIS